MDELDDILYHGDADESKNGKLDEFILSNSYSSSEQLEFLKAIKTAITYHSSFTLSHENTRNITIHFFNKDTSKLIKEILTITAKIANEKEIVLFSSEFICNIILPDLLDAYEQPEVDDLDSLLLNIEKLEIYLFTLHIALQRIQSDNFSKHVSSCLPVFIRCMKLGFQLLYKVNGNNKNFQCDLRTNSGYKVVL